MKNITPFEKYSQRYDEWFNQNKYVYLSELNLIKKIIPKGRGLEVGVGTGRFAGPLGIKLGLDPSNNMGQLASKRGIYILRGVGEYLPVKRESFDFLLNITTVCFLYDLEKAFKETYRILKKKGKIIVGFIDKNSFLGIKYKEKKDENPFYKEAKFYSVEFIVNLLQKTGFFRLKISQIIFKKLENITKIEPIKKGYGEGAFVSIVGWKNT